MAKDGTMRGGPRFGQGRPPKAIQEKIAAGNPGGRKDTGCDFVQRRAAHKLTGSPVGHDVLQGFFISMPDPIFPGMATRQDNRPLIGWPTRQTPRSWGEPFVSG